MKKSSFLKGWEEMHSDSFKGSTVFSRKRTAIYLYPWVMRKGKKIVHGKRFVVRIESNGKFIELDGKRLKYFLTKDNAKKFIKEWVKKYRCARSTSVKSVVSISGGYPSPIPIHKSIPALPKPSIISAPAKVVMNWKQQKNSK